MNRLLAAATLSAAALGAPLTASAGPDVGVSITVAQPGVYGRIDLGAHPRPALVSPQAVIVVPQRTSVRVPPQPVPVWVPDGHRRHWARHCAQYGACGVPVVFVQDRWARDHLRRPHLNRHPVHVQVRPLPVHGYRDPASRPYADPYPRHDRRDRRQGRGD